MVGTRADKQIVADDRRMPRPAADQRVIHHAVSANLPAHRFWPRDRR